MLFMVKQAKKVSEETILEALQYGHNEVRKIVALQKELFEKLGIKKREFVAPAIDEALYQEVKGKVEADLHDAMGHLKIRQAGKPR